MTEFASHATNTLQDFTIDNDAAADTGAESHQYEVANITPGSDPHLA